MGINTKSLRAGLYLLAVFMLSLCLACGGKAEKESLPPSTCGPDNAARETAWTIMVYMDADNSLETAAMEDINEMKRGMTDGLGVNLLVLIDRTPLYTADSSELGEDFSGTRLYRINHGTATWICADSAFPEAAGPYEGEVNMGDAATLKKFVRYSKTQYPAGKYALILWNHGNGVRDPVIYQEEDIVTRSICEDISSGSDVIYTGEITDILTSSESVDFIGFDACMMGSLEVAYQLRPGNGSFNAQVMVASPANEGSYGWPYHTILQRFKTGGGSNGETETITGGTEPYYDPQSMSAAELGRIVVEEYRDATCAYGDQTMSCYDLTQAATVKSAVDALAVELVSEKADFETYIRGSGSSPIALHYFNASKTDEWISLPYFDIYDVARRINADTSHFGSTARTKAQGVQDAVEGMIFYSYAGSSYSGFIMGKNGLSIFCPDGDALYQDKDGDINPHWAYQWWYNPLDTKSVLGSSYLYGKLTFCTGGTTPSSVENWFELLDSWFDYANGLSGGYNRYQW